MTFLPASSQFANGECWRKLQLHVQLCLNQNKQAALEALSINQAVAIDIEQKTVPVAALALQVNHC